MRNWRSTYAQGYFLAGNDLVQTVMKAKMCFFERWQQNGKIEDLEKYKEARKEAKTISEEK